MNDNRPPPGAKPTPMVPIVGIVGEGGRVTLLQPIRRPKPSLSLVPRE
ncbi:hypothetical protein ACO2Q0_02500 [Phenylobacterium sp. VNQ135]